MTTAEIIAQIAKDYLHIDTLDTQNSDGLDFHEVAVWSIRKALQAAFDAGRKTSNTN